MGLQKPIATAIATATPIPIPMIATQSEHDLRPDPHFLIKCPPIYELISKWRILARAPGGQMQGAATQAMPVCIVEERQRRRCPPAAAPLRAAASGPGGLQQSAPLIS